MYEKAAAVLAAPYGVAQELEVPMHPQSTSPRIVCPYCNHEMDKRGYNSHRRLCALTPLERFERLVDKNGPSWNGTPHWLWEGDTSRQYGRYVDQSAYRATGEPQHFMAHRLAYELFIGPIPEGLQLDHLCRVKNCVNPLHLEPVTAQENKRREIQARPLRRVCQNGHSLDDSNVYVTKEGHRWCLACRIANKKRNDDKHRAKVRLENAKAMPCPACGDLLFARRVGNTEGSGGWGWRYFCATDTCRGHSDGWLKSEVVS